MFHRSIVPMFHRSNVPSFHRSTFSPFQHKRPFMPYGMAWNIFILKSLQHLTGFVKRD
jgi:hypothetical protein